MLKTILTLIAAAMCAAADVQPVPAHQPEAPPPAAAVEPPAQPSAAADDSPLSPVRTDSPRQTMRTFMVAMDRYVVATGHHDRHAPAWLDDAIRCLDLSRANAVGREITGREAAVYLKEAIDRVIRIDLERIPADASLERWRLKDTELTIWRIADGDRRGEYLFSPDTVARAKSYFQKVADLPLLPGALGGGWAPPWQERYIPASLKPEVFGVAYWQWLLIAALIFVGLVLRLVARFAAYLVKRVTEGTKATWDDDLVETLAGPVTHLATTGVWFASLQLLGITGTAYTVISFLIKGAFFVNLAYLAYKIAGFLGHQMEHRLRQSRKEVNQSLFKLLRQTLQILSLLFCLLLGAQNMGMDVASLIAGLGIGGLAFALAAKDTLANLFGSVMIMLDHPFRVGDWIVAKGAEGTVEEIGFRSTRIRTFYNSVISIPNSELVMANVDNMGMRQFRRVNETLGITYGTPPEKVEAFCEGIKNIIKANPHTRKDYIQVVFNRFGASSLDVLLYFFLKVDDWAVELHQRQNIFLEIARLAESLGISFAFPTQTLHIESGPGQPAPAQAVAASADLSAQAAAFGPGGARARPAGAGIYTPRYREPT